VTASGEAFSLAFELAGHFPSVACWLLPIGTAKTHILMSRTNSEMDPQGMESQLLRLKSHGLPSYACKENRDE
jgi:hypothetical protein